MSFQLSRQMIGDVVVLRPAGKLTIGVAEIALRDEIRTLIAQGHKKIVLALSKTTSVDSSGFGELVAMYTNLANAGGHVILAELPHKIRDILEITQMITVFQVADTVAEALQLLSGPEIASRARADSPGN